MCYNVFKIKINLLKYNRFKDGRCSQTNAGSNHLNHKEGEKGATSVFLLPMYTAISRKVVAKTVHSTNPKGNMGFDQCTFPDTVAV